MYWNKQTETHTQISDDGILVKYLVVVDLIFKPPQYTLYFIIMFFLFVVQLQWGGVMKMIFLSTLVLAFVILFISAVTFFI